METEKKMDWLKPNWSNKHIDLFSNSYFYALEAVIVKIVNTNPELPINNEVVFLFNYIIAQGEVFTCNFLTSFMEQYNLKRLWLQDMKILMAMGDENK